VFPSECKEEAPDRHHDGEEEIHISKPSCRHNIPQTEQREYIGHKLQKKECSNNIKRDFCAVSRVKPEIHGKYAERNDNQAAPVIEELRHKRFPVSG
jgi:hypothetical protein